MSGSLLDQRGEGLVPLVHCPREVVRTLFYIRGRLGQLPWSPLRRPGVSWCVGGRAKQRVRELEPVGSHPDDARIYGRGDRLDIRFRRGQIRHCGQLRQHVTRLLRKVPQARLDERLEARRQAEVMGVRAAIRDGGR